MKKSLKKSLFILLTLLSIIFIVACGEKASKKEVIEKFVENSLVIHLKKDEEKGYTQEIVSLPENE